MLFPYTSNVTKVEIVVKFDSLLQAYANFHFPVAPVNRAPRATRTEIRREIPTDIQTEIPTDILTDIPTATRTRAATSTPAATRTSAATHTPVASTQPTHRLPNPLSASWSRLLINNVIFFSIK